MSYQSLRRSRRRRLTKKNKSNSKRQKILLVLGIFFFSSIILMASAVVGVYAYVDTLIPDDLTISAASESTFIYDRNGEFLYEIHGDERRTNLASDQIPEVIKQATIALEDKSFYEHKGYDLTGMMRSVLVNIQTDTVASGSTITQQLVKRIFLTPEKTISRKVKEIFMATRIEQKYSKDEILASYLNQIPYGGNVSGIQAAAEYYFNKNASDLTLAEATVLVGIPQRPSRNTPFSGKYFDLEDDLLVDPTIAEQDSWQHQKYYDFSKIVNERKVIDIWRQRQIKTLNLMIEQGFITEEDADNALAQPMDFSHAYETINAPHFVLYIRDLLEEKYGEKEVLGGGLRVYTSLDYGLQQEAERIVREQIDSIRGPFNAHNSALVAMDPTTGEVLAYVGSVDYFDTANDGNVDVASSLRQPGSSFKPFAYATAFKKGYNANTMVMDVSTDFGGGYRPRNYDGRDHGPTTLRNGLSNSYNISAVKALYIAGIDDTVATATDLGITTLEGKGADCGLSLTLGCAEVKLYDMVTAYSTFAAQGKKVTPRPILKITDSQGKIIEEFKPEEGEQVLDPGVAYMISDILSDNQARTSAFGWNTPLRVSRRAAVKTGTTNDIKDNWTVGYTPNLTVGVWVGNNNGDPLTGHASGVTGAAPIWHEFMEKAFESKPDVSWYDQPDSVTWLEVDNLSGLKPNEFTGEDKSNALILKNFVEALPEDDIRIKLTIDKQNGLIANPATPQDLREEKIFLKVHPVIKEDDPSFTRWMADIQKWIDATKQADPNTPFAVPTEVSPSYYNESNAPTVTIVSPADGTNFTDQKVLVEATAVGPYPIVSVDFFHGNQKVKSFDQMQDSYTIEYLLSDGTYTILVKATDDHGATGSASISISVDTKFHVAIDSPLNKAYVGKSFSVQADVNAPVGVKQVVFQIDGSTKKTLTSAPFEATLTASNGKHDVSVIGTNKQGETSTDVVTVTIDTQAPAAFQLSGTCTIKLGHSCKFTADPIDVGDAGIGHVEFYVQKSSSEAQLAQDIQYTPASYTFKPTEADSYAIYAVAFDRAGNTKQSSKLAATVTD